MKRLLLLSFILILILYIKDAHAAKTLVTTKFITDEPLQYLRLQLAKDVINKDEIVVLFKAGASTKYDPKNDAIYFSGTGQVNISSYSSDLVPLSFNIQPLPATSATIGLNVNTKTNGRYQLNMTELIGIPQLFDIWLMDAYTKDSLDMRHNATYSFIVSKIDSNTFGSKRFTLVIRQNRAYACHLLSFTANKVANVKQVQILWGAENEQDYTKYTVERSTDNGKTYTIIDALNSDGHGTYSFTDKSPVTGQNLYRLKQEDINNAITFSTNAQVFFSNMDNALAGGDSAVSLSVYPNPVSNIINIAIAEKLPQTTTYNITITNISGFPVKQVTTTQPNWQGEISDLQTGVYLVKVINSKDKSLIGYSKFAKN